MAIGSLQWATYAFSDVMTEAKRFYADEQALLGALLLPPVFYFTCTNVPLQIII